ncbi:GNAT family N-acetyltransferase [Lederbergia citri]|uniref:GNAT family N-acetyltransferase n=1 Tax=Lederbergia citri TaxID=2833580 RepID=A0A942YHI1_9BACI|nr:GNAT family N-acetyltransferase [Lederbergia citri]MBS4195814.1 GNAT family N-acetyltransferase [Lederbergia citri]
MEVEIKNAGVEDTDIIAHFFTKVGGEEVEVNETFFDNEGNILLIAYLEGIACGIVYGYILSSISSEKRMLFLYSIDVLPEYQNRRIGSALIERLKDIAAHKNCFEMFVLTNDSNTSAKKLYERTGGIRENVDDLLYVFPINQTP